MDLYSIGEMVIDFLPGSEPGVYLRNAGGAPANVAIAAARGGLDAGFCGMLGDDDFGRFLLGTLRENGVRPLCPPLTGGAVTTMVFVSLQADGERSFTFARKPGADMLLDVPDVNEADLAAATVVHAGSCSLSAGSAVSATLHALRRGHELGKLVSFDVNYRSLLWNGDANAAARRVREVLPFIDLLKLSEEEAPMLGGEEAIPALMAEHGIALVVETLGSKGARCWFGGQVLHAACPRVAQVDATGAGDAFWGAFLCGLLRQGVSTVAQLSLGVIESALERGNVAGALCVQKKGAISSLPTRDEIDAYLAEREGVL